MEFNWFRRRSSHCSSLIANFNSVPVPPGATLARDCHFLAFDLETTGLNARKDCIVSVGWVPVRGREIILAEARHYLVQSPVSVGQSATVHGLHDRQLENARQLQDVLSELFGNYAGYVFAAHYAELDRLFLLTETRRCFGAAPQLYFIDTLALERQRLQREGTVVKNAALRLPDCLKRHGLPVGVAHNAVEDAYGCALLLLAQIGHSKFPLAELLRQSR